MNAEPLEHARNLLCRYFPAPLPDETLFSLASRFNSVLGTRNARVAGKILVGLERAAQSSSVVSNLSLLASLLPSHFRSPLTILHEHTLGGLYLRFMRERARELATESALGRRRPRWVHAFGWMTKRFDQHHPLRYCPDCAASELDTHPSSYWHLRQQAPLVQYCLLHQRALVEVPRPRMQWVVPSTSLQGSAYSVTEFHMQYAAVAPLLFSAWNFSVVEGRRNVVRLLEDAGVIPSARWVDIERVRRFLHLHVPQLVFEQAMAIARTRADDWLAPFLKGDGNQHPVWFAIVLTCLAREGVPKQYIEETAQGPSQYEIPGLRAARLPSPPRVYAVLEQGGALAECARTFDVPASIVRRWLRDPVLHACWAAAKMGLKRTEHRGKALDVKSRLKVPTREGLKRLCSDALQWLAEHDAQWLDENFPSSQTPGQMRLLFNKGRSSAGRAYRAPAWAYELMATGAPLDRISSACLHPVEGIRRWLRDPVIAAIYNRKSRGSLSQRLSRLRKVCTSTPRNRMKPDPAA